ncbi:MAG: hypothetical protein JST70_00780 [Bacteroidetes bacterium]|nr:hypothetical protein [Bacteroidota bacterium]
MINTTAQKYNRKMVNLIMPDNSENKQPAKKERAKKYDKKLVVKGSFMEVIKASVKDAKSKSAPKKKPE